MRLGWIIIIRVIDIGIGKNLGRRRKKKREGMGWGKEEKKKKHHEILQENIANRSY